MSHPDRLPDLFLDRSLGRIKVPRLLRGAGLRIVTLSEHYGIPADEGVPDDEWLRLAGSRGWVVFMKDTRIRYNRAEREAVKAHGVRCFCLANQSLTRRRDGGQVPVQPCVPAACPGLSSTRSTGHASRRCASETGSRPEGTSTRG